MRDDILEFLVGNLEGVLVETANDVLFRQSLALRIKLEPIKNSHDFSRILEEFFTDAGVDKFWVVDTVRVVHVDGADDFVDIIIWNAQFSILDSLFEFFNIDISRIIGVQFLEFFM